MNRVKKEPKLNHVAQEFADKYELQKIRFEGSGAFKETYRATQKNGQFVALKLMDPLKSNPTRSNREIDALLKCNSLLIAKLYDYGEFDSSNGIRYLFSIEEYLDGGNLTKQINNKTLTKEEIRSYAITLSKALEYLDTINLVHRDIKPDNIMFRKLSPEPVLVDFGIVRDLSKTSVTESWQLQGPCTPYYAAPEQLNNDKHLIDWRTDQFCLGIVLGICLSGLHPFSSPEMRAIDTIDAIAERRQCTTRFSKIATDTNFEFIIKMLNPWPVRRFRTPSELIRSLEFKE